MTGFPDITTDLRFPNLLAARDLCAGTFITVGGAAVVEICGAVGLDFVILDTEHTPIGWEQLSSMCVSALYSGTFPILRVSTTRRDLAARALDAGARGVMFPQVETADEALVAARSCRYPPEGTRGVAATRNMAYGVGRPVGAYLPAANRAVVCIVQVETGRAIDQIESIAAVPGLDCLFVGLSDLAADLGAPGDFRHPNVEAALDRVLAAARPHGIPVGVPIADLSLRDTYRERGVSLFATTDRAIVATGMASFRENIT
jgi:2-dehydro-3-deoxyglucarate aldolase